MENSAKSIYIFKTNIASPHEVAKIAPVFDGKKEITRWFVDTQDIDKVLRIEAEAISPKEIEILLVKEGFRCIEMAT